MPEGPDGKTIIIVKKISGHGGHHGGAWKVAYADFVTAMMAFFMVLWLVNSAASPTREVIASYFRRPGIFTQGSGTPLEIGGGGILGDAFAPPSEMNSVEAIDDKIYSIKSTKGDLRDAFRTSDGNDKGALQPTNQSGAEKSQAGPADAQGKAQQEAFELAAKLIKQALSEQLSDPLNKGIGQIDVKVDQRGLHLDIMDTDKASMFERGSAAITADARRQLLRISGLLATLPNPVDIEGHTDAVPYRAVGTLYDNWNLSADRANAARRVLQEAGVRERQVARVVGYASARPKLPNNPEASANRRISVSMRYTEQAASALEGTRLTETQSIPLQGRTPQPPTVKAVANTPNSGWSTGEDLKGNPPAAKGPTQAPATPPATDQKGGKGSLKVEVQTTLPEGVPLTGGGGAPSNRPDWLEDDKIFGETNPFFNANK